MAVEAAVHQVDTGAPLRFGDEADLDLAGMRGIGLELPVRTDVPAQDDPLRRFEGA